VHRLCRFWSLLDLSVQLWPRTFCGCQKAVVLLLLEAQVSQSWMAFGTSPECPVVFAIGFGNGEIVD
jgi:hypothetical protein